MTPTTEGPPPLVEGAWLATFRSRLAAAEGLLLCLDFDGTLAPIVPDPDAATLRPDADRALRSLAATPSTTVAVVSGRALSDLADRVAVPGVVLAGNHGLEWTDGHERQVDPAARRAWPALGDAVRTLRSALADVPGCTVEDKGLSVTVHYREASEDAVPEVREAVESAAADADALVATAGKQIHELRPAAPAGKGRVVRRLRRYEPDALPVFVGDDRTDEDGFRAVADDGIGVLVGNRADTAASVRVPDTDGVAALLEWVADTAGARSVESVERPR